MFSGLPRLFAKIGPPWDCPAQPMQLHRSANCRITGTGARPLRVFGL